jgi:hypothetical protein
MKLSNDNTKAILLDTHQDINNFADNAVSIIFGNNLASLTYPPNVDLTAEEIAALKTIVPSDNLKNALKKILADNSAAVMFNLFNNIDGTTDPKNNSDNWTGVKLIDLDPDDDEDSENFLHDEFYSTYWDWHKD